VPVWHTGVDTIGQTVSETGHREENQFLIALFEALVPSGASQPRGNTMAKKAKKAKKAKARKKK
jgi:hypothetical protein